MSSPAVATRPAGRTDAKTRSSEPRFRGYVVSAVFKRNVLSYFSGVLGYLFIVAFVVAGAFLAFSPLFFTNNLANLDQLSEAFPMLLLFLVPAITMSTWSDEKKLGTDELLFTLPASDFEVLLGKYLAVLAVYTIALLFSLSHLFVLAWIGNPDWGLMATTYFGYWLAGAALLSAGMFGSVLTSSNTVAFVIGAVFCAIPVFIGYLAPSSNFVRNLSVSEQLRDFTMGIAPLTGVLYFASLTVFMLYLNYVFIKRRHWSGGQQTNMGLHFAARTALLAVFLLCWNYIAASGSTRVDMTAEGLYSLSNTTRDVLKNIKDTVEIQAFVSPDVPREYVPVQKRLLGLLRQYDQMAGSKVSVRFVDVEPFSEAADEAQVLGITPQRILTERDGRRVEEDIYLGAVVGSSNDEVTIPFFGAGTPVEYELTRSIGTVSNEKRLTVGVLRTDSQVMSGSSSWQIVRELKKQYIVTEVSADSEIPAAKYDVLLAVMPSSLTDPQLDNLVNYVKTGAPVLIFDDPFPWVFNSGFGVSNAPSQPKPSPGGQMAMMGMQQPPEQKADGGRLTRLLSVLGIAWEYDQIVWGEYRPPEFAAVVPEEFIFISPKSGVKSAFAPDDEITSGLQELLVAFAGTVVPRQGHEKDVTSLLKTGVESGLLDWDEFTQQSFDITRMAPTSALKPDRRHRPDEYSHIIAARIKGDRGPDAKVNAVFVADVDMISDWFFQERVLGQTSLNLDNVTFVLNAVDSLAGDERYIGLRKRRAEHRTLLAVEARTADFVKQRNAAEEVANEQANKELEAVKESFETQRKQIEEDASMDQREKSIRLETLQATEQRKLDVSQANIERSKQEKIDEAKTKTERQVRETENRIRYLAVLFPPIPAILLGIFVLSRRLVSERRNVNPERMRS